MTVYAEQLKYAEHALSERLRLGYVVETNRIQGRPPYEAVQVRMEYALRVGLEHAARLIWC